MHASYNLEASAAIDQFSSFYTTEEQIHELFSK
jgi:hypothetical protein